MNGHYGNLQTLNNGFENLNDDPIICGLNNLKQTITDTSECTVCVLICVRNHGRYVLFDPARKQCWDWKISTTI